MYTIKIVSERFTNVFSVESFFFVSSDDAMLILREKNNKFFPRYTGSKFKSAIKSMKDRKDGNDYVIISPDGDISFAPINSEVTVTNERGNIVHKIKT